MAPSVGRGDLDERALRAHQDPGLLIVLRQHHRPRKDGHVRRRGERADQDVRLHAADPEDPELDVARRAAGQLATDRCTSVADRLVADRHVEPQVELPVAADLRDQHLDDHLERTLVELVDGGAQNLVVRGGRADQE
jgi:hypothetical protein